MDKIKNKTNKAELQMHNALTGHTLRKIFAGGAAALEKNKVYIDSLNVFPVPDGDTGTNMMLTMRSVLRELETCESNDLAAIGEAIARGGLRGARGNSGVIISQIFKGVTTEIRQMKSGAITTKVFANAMDAGARIAYQAVTVPKEGTMLTVIRTMAAEAKSIARKEATFEKFFTEVIKKGEEILAQTPEMLPILKKAGVVDAGGRGLVTIFIGFLNGLTGVESLEEETSASNTTTDTAEGIQPSFEDLGDIEFAYCTEFMITNINKAATTANIDFLREKLLALGDSVICIGDLKLIKVHLHTNAPGAAITEALTLGEIINLKVDNMLQQNREHRESRKIPEKAQGIVAVAAGDGIVGIFKDLGVDYVVKGGQTMNPSADEIARACGRVHAKNIFVFPNNKNILLAARHAQGLVDKNLIVIPTKSINEGIAACISFNAEATPEENTDAFLEAINSVKSGAVTYAVRNTHLGRFDIKEGEVIGLDDKTIIAKGKKVEETTLKLIEKMIDDNSVNITLFFGSDIAEREAYGLQDKLTGKYPKCEVNMVSGGQPVYYYLVSIE